MRTALTIGPPEDIAMTIEALGAVELCNVYGSTETYGSCAVTDAKDPLPLRLHSGVYRCTRAFLPRAGLVYVDVHGAHPVARLDRRFGVLEKTDDAALLHSGIVHARAGSLRELTPQQRTRPATALSLHPAPPTCPISCFSGKGASRRCFRGTEANRLASRGRADSGTCLSTISRSVLPISRDLDKWIHGVHPRLESA
jgi:hypothetical protein